MTDELKAQTDAVEGKGGESSAPSAPPPPAKAAPPPKKEKPDKCEQCGKNLGRIKWYYRNGGYYCTRRCWKEFEAKKKEEREKAAAAAGPKT